MPASREIIFIKIKQLEEMIHEASSRGQDVSELQLQLEQARKSFAMTGVALNENTSLLKG